MKKVRILLVVALLAAWAGPALAVPETPPDEKCVESGGLWVPYLEECLTPHCPPRCPGDIVQS